MSLHDEIMNIKCEPDDVTDPISYRRGHGSARHAAAELAIKADAEIGWLMVCHDRYEKLRRLNPRQFAELYAKNLSADIAFDALVDAL